MRRTSVFVFVAAAFAAVLCCGSESSASDERKGSVTLPSGATVQLEQMGFGRATDGWFVSFNYVTSTNLQDAEAVRSEAAELFQSHLKKVADTTDPKIKAAVLYAFNEPKATDGRLQKRVNYGTVFMRLAKTDWKILPLKK